MRVSVLADECAIRRNVARLALDEDDFRASRKRKVGDAVYEVRLAKNRVRAVGDLDAQLGAVRAGESRARARREIADHEGVAREIRRAGERRHERKPRPVAVRRESAIADVERLAGKSRAGGNLQIHRVADDGDVVRCSRNDRPARKDVRPVVCIERVASVVRRPGPQGHLLVLVGYDDLRGERRDESVLESLGRERIAVEKKRRDVRGGIRDAGADESVRGDVMDDENMPVEIENGTAVENEPPAIGPVGVGVENDRGRSASLREVGGAEHVRRAVNRYAERPPALPVVVLAAAVAAVRVAGDYGEAVPPFRHRRDAGILARESVVADHVFAVYENCEIVVEHLLESPFAGLVRRHVEPAVVTKLRPLEIAALP